MRKMIQGRASWWLLVAATLMLTPGSKALPDCPEADPNDTSVYFPHETDCDKFYECSSGVPYLFDCPAGLHFDPVDDVCDYPEKVTCANAGSDKTTTETSATEPPATEAPATEPPATEPPTTEPPATEAPATEPPATEPPATEPPATEAPATEPPATEPPATEPPATEPPTTEPPATEAPATEPPATEPPATEPPATEPPATEPPATEAPATEPPATEPPATEPPATEAPATEPPATEPPATVTCPAVDSETSIYFAHEYDCGRFYQCSNGVSFLHSCPAGLHFNPKLNVCDYPEKVRCANTGSDKTTTETSVAEPPATEAPAPDPPATEAPAPEPPATEAPAPEPPATEAPAPEPPATEAPTPEPPATEAPAPEPPATEAPAPEPPATEAPAPEPPATEAPAPEPPATEAPAPEPPATEAPAPEPPATEAPAPEPPATEAPAPEPPATEAPAPEPPATEAPTSEPSTTVTCPAVDSETSIYFPYEYDCGRFYQCSNGVPVLHSCPAGLHFNPKLNVCDWPENAGCSSGQSPPSQTPGGSGTDPGLQTTTQSDTAQWPVSTTKTPDTDGSSSASPGTCPKVDQAHTSTYLPHESNCGLFYQCSNGLPVLQACPVGLHFNPTLNVCDWPRDAGCTAGSTTQSPSVSSTEKPADPAPDGGYSTTPSATVGGDTSTSIPHGRCSECSLTSQIWSDGADCAKFWSCLDGEPVSKTCSAGLLFNSENKVCDHADNVSCQH